MFDLSKMTDAQAADHLAQWWRTRTTEQGTRETYDPNAGLWLDDADLVRNHRARSAARAILGSREDTFALNGAGL